MKFNPHIHHRRSIRLKGYDYALVGAYFVTLVTWQRSSLFGDIVLNEMQLNPCGRIVNRVWFDLPNHYPHVELDAFCILPNHVHGIIVLTGDDAADIPRRGGSTLIDMANDSALASDSHDNLSAPQTRPYTLSSQTRPDPNVKRHSLSEIVRAFKSFSARRINTLRHMQGASVWQRNYYEHIIRSEQEYQKIADYIMTNPLHWENDSENTPYTSSL